MKHSLILKFLVILLAAFSLVTAIGGGAGIIAMENAGLYVNGLDMIQSQEYESVAREIANRYAELYAAEKLGQLPYKLKLSMFPDPAERGDSEYWRVKLQQGGEVLSDPGNTEAFPQVMEFTVRPLYPIATTQSGKGPSDETTAPTTATEDSESTEETQLPAAAAADAYGYVPPEIPTGYLYRETESYWDNGNITTYYLYYYEAPVYTVTVYMQEEVLDSSAMHMLTTVYPHRYTCIGVLIAGLIVFAACMVFLFWTAGKDAMGETRPGGLNRLPLDLYAGAAGLGIVLLILLFGEMLRWVQNEGPHPGNLSLLALNLLAITLLGIGISVAFAAQLKVKNGYWWRHSVIGWCLCKLGAGIRLALQGIRAVFRLLPLIWQWLLTALIMAVCVLIATILLVSCSHSQRLFFLLLLLVTVGICVAVICYGAYAFGSLMKGIHRMTQGELSYKVSTKYLVGSYLEFANRLNSLSETAMIAAQRQMKSERMRTELITNVSHDIKTPLTSIINFVDLLQKPHTPQENAQYLEVLSRQSARMKKLIDDLMELSKASTGNLTVSILRMDAAETVNQALGEFADKLEAASLYPVFRQPEQPVFLLADGKLVWRVLSNLLTNAIKYAMPGTRIYVDLMQIEDKVLLSLKNISREQMTVTAEELMERFVRGDAARNSEGSGLGLNIARSLMEVQNGQLNLLLDGDLFKVTLIFPRG